MGRESGSPKSAEVVGQLPPGTRSVERTTRERFIEPPPSLDEDESPELLAETTDDVADEFEEFETQEPVSRVQAFISSLKEGAGDGTIRIYAIRKPDPPGIEFRNPCNQEYTAGDVPFDESDLSVEALEVAIQKLYGGGRYQIKVRQNGNYAGAITRNIRDLPEQRGGNQANQPQSAAPAASPVPPFVPAKTAKEELTESIELMRTLHTIMGGGPQQNPPPSLPTAPPADNDPFKAAESSLNLLRTAKELFERDEPAPGPSSGHWVEGVFNGAARLLGSPAVVQFATVLASALIAPAPAANGSGAATTPSGSKNPELPSAAPAGPSPASQTTASYQPSAPAPISPEALAVLEIVVAELRGYEKDEDSELLEERTKRAATAIRTLPPHLLELLGTIPPVMLLPSLINLNPAAWSDIAAFTDAGTFMDALWGELQSGPEEGTGDLVEFPPREETEN